MRLAPQLLQKPRRLLLKVRGRPGQMLVAAALAAHAQKTVLKSTTRQVVLELARYVPWQKTTGLTPLHLKFRPILLHQMIQQCLFGLMLHMGRCPVLSRLNVNSSLTLHLRLTPTNRTPCRSSLQNIETNNSSKYWRTNRNRVRLLRSSGLR
jgi:hypothetical protein